MHWSTVYTVRLLILKPSLWNSKWCNAKQLWAKVLSLLTASSKCLPFSQSPKYKHFLCNLIKFSVNTMKNIESRIRCYEKKKVTKLWLYRRLRVLGQNLEMSLRFSTSGSIVLKSVFLFCFFWLKVRQAIFREEYCMVACYANHSLSMWCSQNIAVYLRGPI